MRRPDKLMPAGRALWNAVARDARQVGYTLKPDERRVLTDACHVADRITLLRRASRQSPPMVRGSNNYLIVNPALVELRHLEDHLAKMLGRLRLPDARDVAPVNQQREAGMSRWAAAHGSPE
jgi:hypothetical protein